MSVGSLSNSELLTYFKENDTEEVRRECLARMGEQFDTPIPNQISMDEMLAEA